MLKRKKKKTLLKAQLILEYYYGNNILEPYRILIDRLVIDKDCLDLLKEPNEMFYITPLSKFNRKSGSDNNE